MFLAPTAVHNILITGGDRLDTSRAIFAERASGRQNVIDALLPGILLLLGILWWKHSSGAVRGKLPGYTASGIVLYRKRCAGGVHGQYHRGKVNLLLRQEGMSPVPGDFIAYVRGAPAATSRPFSPR